MEEVWKTVVVNGEIYEEYEVSNLGRLKSLNYKRTGEEKILSPGNNGNNYLQIILCKNGTKKYCKIHRLVAEAFIPNTDNLPCIDHINTIRTDNRVQNLRWCDYKQNCNNELTKTKYKARCHTAETKNKISEAHKGKHHTEETKKKIRETCKGKLSKKILCVETGEIFNSLSEASEQLGVNISNISSCCTGKRKTTGKLHWQYVE